MSTELAKIFEDADAPLKRAEHIVKEGPDADAGPLPCENEPEAQCLTFTALNRMRFERAPCGCSREERGPIIPCAEHCGVSITEEDSRRYLESGGHQTEVVA